VPNEAGAVNVTMREVINGLIPVIVGAEDDGIVVVMLFDSEEGSESPTEFVATTVNVYAVLFDK
jgi:hypothetical protein